MNTGKIIETSRLYLIPGKNSRDDEAFIKMLRQDGNFRKLRVLSSKKSIQKSLEIILKEKVTVNVSIPYIERTKKILQDMWVFTKKLILKQNFIYLNQKEEEAMQKKRAQKL